MGGPELSSTNSMISIQLGKTYEPRFISWFGGIGIIVLALSILPTLQIGGMQLLHMEHDDPYEKTLPKVGQFVFEIFIIYLCLTIVCAVLYFIAGMTDRYAINLHKKIK